MNSALDRKPLLLHLGCGAERLDGFVNIDVRPTPATDLVADLNDFSYPAGTVAGAYSHAFFEHLRRSRRVPHLKAVRQALAPDGFICYIGLPYFKNIARFYLEKAPGIARPVFDLFDVYRQTHGDPEQTPDYLEQMHKSLFDEDELAALLLEAGFPRFLLFTYCYVREHLPVNIGFYASRLDCGPEVLRGQMSSFLQQFENVKIRAGTLAILVRK